MSKIPSRCCQERSDKKIPIRDKKSKNTKSEIILNNSFKKTVELIEIEDCVINTGERCDYFVSIIDEHKMLIDNEQAIFIELKGNDVPKALSQLNISFHFIKKNYPERLKNQKIIFLLSCTRCPLSSTEVDNHKVKLKRQYGITLLVKSGKLEHKI